MSILDDLKSLDPNDPGRWPLPVRAAAVVLCFVVLSAVLFYFFVWSDQKPRLDQATAEEVAEAFFYLASPQASYITGTWLDVNGGLVLR